MLNSHLVQLGVQIQINPGTIIFVTLTRKTQRKPWQGSGFPWSKKIVGSSQRTVIL